MSDVRLATRMGSDADARASVLLAAGLSLGPAVAIGFGRFAYALLLPGMRADLVWTFAQAGAMNTANAAGYLLGALFTVPIASRLGGRRAFTLGMAVTAATLLASGATGAFIVLLALRLLAGGSGAVTFIVGGALAAHAGGRSGGRAALLLAIYFAGGGFGILVSALAVNPLLAIGGAHGWRIGWVGLGIVSLLALLAVQPAVRQGDALPSAPQESGAGWSPRPLLSTFITYTLFGAGYIAYITFIIALLRAEGNGTGIVSAFWAVLGIASIASALLWGPVLERLRAGGGLALVMAGVTIGAALPLVSRSGVAAFTSAILFGGAFLGVVTAVTSLARRTLPPHAWTAGIAALTVVFAIGQCVGPILSGLLSDRSGGVRVGLALSAGILLVGTLAALGQRE